MDVAMNGSLQCQDIGTCRPPLTVSVERGSEWLHSGRLQESGGHKRRSSDPTARDTVVNGVTVRSRTWCRCTYNARTQHTTEIVYEPLKRLVRKRKEREEERSLVSSRHTYNQSKIAGWMHLVSLNNKKASRNDGTYLRINVNPVSYTHLTLPTKRIV